MLIKRVLAEKIKNSRGEPALQVTVNKHYTASVPSGASKGSNEVRTFPQGGIDYAIRYINHHDELKTMEINSFQDLALLERLDEHLGGNGVLALQYACLRALSNNKVWKYLNPRAKQIPKPLGNVIGGGMHYKNQATDIQEFLLLPGSKSIYENVFVNAQIHKKIVKILGTHDMTDEGAWAPKLSNIAVLDLLKKFLEQENNTFGVPVKLGLDIASTSFWNGTSYVYKNFSQTQMHTKLDKKQQINLINKLIEDYNLAYVEDPLHENDFEGFSKISKRTLVCGDDLITTNLERLKNAIRIKAINCIIIKPNQIGSIVKAKEVVDFAKEYGTTCVISHRSGETMDDMISHLAVAWQIPYIKCGIYGRERQAKLSTLVEIEREIHGM